MINRTLLTSLSQKVDPENAALLVIDVQNDFCHPDGWNKRKKWQDNSATYEMIPRLEQLVDTARAAGVQIIWVRAQYDDHFNADPLVERFQRQGTNFDCCATGTWGAEYYVLKPKDGDLEVMKHRFSAFTGTALDVILRDCGLKTVICTGVTSNVCVDSTARDAFFLGYYVVFVSDCTASYSPALHEATLETMRNHFGLVATAEEVAACWKSGEGELNPAQSAGI